MSWLLPKMTLVAKLHGRIRTVGEPNKKANVNARSRKWRRSAKGQAWRKSFRQQRNAYDRRWYIANHARRRAYLASKKREYRAKQKECAPISS